MTWIVARGVKDRPGKCDASQVFIPESDMIAAILCQSGRRVIDVGLVGSPEPLWKAIREAGGDLEGLVYVGHGLPRGLPTAGLRGLAGARLLASHLLAQRGGKALALTVVLFACLAADNPKQKGRGTDGPGTDGGFADELRDVLAKKLGSSVIVYAHSTGGHATMNPYLAAFMGPASQGGYMVVRPRSGLWPRWKRMLKTSLKDGPSLRHRIPLLYPWDILVDVAEAE